jgi:hypothetical protein
MGREFGAECRGNQSRRFVESLGQWLRWPVSVVLLCLALGSCDASTGEEAKTSQGGGVVVVEVTATPSPVLPIAGNTPPPTRMSGASSIEEAEARWQASGITDYQIRVVEVDSVWCSYVVDLEVRQGQVVTGTVLAQPGPADDCRRYTGGVVDRAVGLSLEQARRWTVPSLFRIAHNWGALAGTASMRIRLEFDPERGYPTVLSKDNEVAEDDDLYLETVQFTRWRP